MARRAAHAHVSSTFHYPPHFVWLKYRFFKNVFGLSGIEAEELAAAAYSEAVAAAGGLPSRALLARVADCNAKDVIRQRQRRALRGTEVLLSDLLSRLGPDGGDVFSPDRTEEAYLRTMSDYSHVAAQGPEKLFAEKEVREAPLPASITPCLREVADLMTQGITDVREIASALGITEVSARQRKFRLLRDAEKEAKKANDRLAALLNER